MDIIQDGRIIGQAQVWQEGLYYRFDCRCQPIGMCRLAVCCGEHREYLGIPVPRAGEFILTTRIAVKKIGRGEMRIVAEAKHRGQNNEFISVDPEEPFQWLSMLQNAYLQERSGKIGVIINRP